MSAPDNPRRLRARVQSKPFGISTYEHVELLEPAKEFPGRKPVPRGQWKEQVKAHAATVVDKRRVYTSKDPQDAYMVDEEEEETGKVGTTGRIWRTRRRRDGKMFLATEYVDKHGIMNDAKETLLRLLNHPNLVCLVDVVQDTNIGLEASDYTVWEDCLGGTLNRYLWRENEEEDPIEIPEGLCWHVLDGISQALLWLHHGHKHTFPFNQHMEHDDDWHPILISEITPANIYFAAREGVETYGDVKLGNFRSASVKASKLFIEAIRPPWIPIHGPYTAPEIRRNLYGISDASEVWSLGAVLYHMMAGAPPLSIDPSKIVGNPSEADFWVRSLPRRYSSRLREIVMGMLRVNRTARPTVDDLSVVVDSGWAAWREDTDEGKGIVLKGEPKHLDEAGKSQIEELFPDLVKLGRFEDL